MITVDADHCLTERVAAQLTLRLEQVTAAVTLFDAGNTLPFIARYRKELTGGLDEEQLRQISTLVQQGRVLDERRAAILVEIETQGRLTPDLRAQILAAETRTALEDLYQPYKPKRRTRASMARERGILSAWISAPTPLCSQTWARSEERPSLISIIALTQPESASFRPSAIRGTGSRCFCTSFFSPSPALAP